MFSCERAILQLRLPFTGINPQVTFLVAGDFVGAHVQTSLRCEMFASVSPTMLCIIMRAKGQHMYSLAMQRLPLQSHRFGVDGWRRQKLSLPRLFAVDRPDVAFSMSNNCHSA